VSAPLLRVERLAKTYRSGDLETPVLRGVSLEIERGATASLIGVSGSGKSTLLSLLAGLMRPQSGSVAFDGTDLAQLDDRARARLRASRIGVVLQSGNLIPFLTAEENVELAVKLAGGARRPERATALLHAVGLLKRLDHKPARLSGGEAQRVAVAVALANEPDLLLADEITGQLDAETADEVMDVIFTARHGRGLTVLFVTHSAALAARAERRFALVDGEVVAA
jgi:predicted ABC-type transport system involved in lysophospholipase L1 biosynthesis ATPase subunit